MKSPSWRSSWRKAWDSFCSFCKTAVLVGLEDDFSDWGTGSQPHHENIKDLIDSAKDGCCLCARLFARILDEKIPLSMSTSVSSVLSKSDNSHIDQISFRVEPRSYADGSAPPLNITFELHPGKTTQLV